MSDAQPFLHFVNTVNTPSTLNAELQASSAVNGTTDTSVLSAVTHQLPSPTLVPTPTTGCVLAPTPPATVTHALAPPTPQLAYANPNAEKTILAYFYIAQPREAIRTGQRKTRLIKQDPLAFGPKPIPFDVTFHRLLEIISTAIQTRPEDIDSSSIQWKPRTPANAKPQPLRDVAGVNGMLSQVVAKAKPFIDYIIEITLDPPRKARPVYVCNFITLFK